MLERDTWPHPDPNLTLPVRDWLKKYVAGKPLPIDAQDLTNDPDAYKSIEWIVAVLNDHYLAEDDGEGFPKSRQALPKSAQDFVYQYLDALEEKTDIHIWNEAQVARAALPIMLCMCAESDGNAELLAVKAGLSTLCTKEELAEFEKRHGLAEETKSMKAKPDDYIAALDAAHILADPNTPEETRGKLQDAINELSMSADVPVWHPALVERALTIMFENLDQPISGKQAKFRQKDRQQGYEKLHAFLAGTRDAEPS